MKKILERIIQTRNSKFQFDEAITTRLIFTMVWEKGFYLLRGLKLLFRFRNPQNLLLGKGVRFFNLTNISFGKWVKLDDYVYLNALGSKRLKLGNNVGIGAFSRLVVATSFNNIGDHITIGNNVGIGEFSYLGGAGGLEIGDNCIIGQYLSCHPENHNFHEPTKLIRHQEVTRKGIKIGRNCWIGAKVTVLDGVTIGENCVIAAGSVVTKNISNNSLIAGIPARVIKSTYSINKNVA